MSKPSQPTTPLTPARKTAYGLAIVAGLLTSATQFVTYPSALLIALLQIMVSVLCLLLCLREPFDGPGRFSPVFIAAIALALSFFVVPG